MENTATHLSFSEKNTPALETGNYELHITQELTDGDNNKASYERKLSFSVSGDRFSLSPSLVHSVFPPANGKGEYSGVLPHLIIKRTTLPWERHAKDKNKESPWLALLVFDAGELEIMPFSPTAAITPEARLEAETGYVLRTADLLPGGFSNKPGFENLQKAWPGIALETGQSDSDRVLAIFVRKKLLAKLLPSFKDLPKLAHVRRATDSAGKLAEEEQAVILSNRLPGKGTESIVHLVSLEKRFSETEAFEFHDALEEDVVPLISLYSWRFRSSSPRHTFRGFLLHLNQQTVFRVPVSTDLNLTIPRKNVMTQKLRAQFARAGHPLSEDGNTRNTDRAWQEVVLNNHHYLIGNSGNVYNQAGYLVFRKNGSDATGHPIPENASLKKLDIPCWWIEDTITKRRYFLRQENGEIEALQLELDHAPVLRLPETGDSTADRFLHQGYVLLPHYLRRGGKTASWFRGPLTTAEKKAATLDRSIFSVSTSDELLIYHTDTGMFDVTYSAAWELGRLLALQSKHFSVALHKWRRSHARAAAQAELHEAHLHLPLSGTGNTGELKEFPGILHNWLSQLWTLEGIPYNYLVPDARLLPGESLRFFSLDPDWMACLVHGAFSIGQDAGTNHWYTEDDDHPVMQNLQADKPLDGFLLKSEVVSGYPGMEIEVSTATENSTRVIRRQLSTDTILCLFEGPVTQVTFRLKPDVLHFGLEETEDGWSKSFRGPDGKQLTTTAAVRVDPDTRIVEIRSLFEEARNAWKTKEAQTPSSPEAPFGSGHFALALLEGGSEISYLRLSPPHK